MAIGDPSGMLRARAPSHHIAVPIASRDASAAAFGEEPVLRPRQAEVLAQGLALVFAPEDAAALQLRHHAIGEILEPAGEVGEHHGEAVGAFAREPFLHLVGDRLRRADHGEAAIAAEPLGELPHRQVLAARQLDRPLATALAGVALGNLWQRSVRIELGGVVAERDRE